MTILSMGVTGKEVMIMLNPGLIFTLSKPEPGIVPATGSYTCQHGHHVPFDAGDSFPDSCARCVLEDGVADEPLWSLFWDLKTRLLTRIA